jgi:hypothetical protein
LRFAEKPASGGKNRLLTFLPVRKS